MYNPASKKADEFISHEEIMETLQYADENKNNLELIDRIIEKAKLRKGLSHREASVLLACENDEKNQEIYHLAEQIKKDFYGNRIVMFAPLYLSNYCINGCTYCPYHMKNKHIPRKKLTQDEIRKEVIALQDMGHKRLALEAGEDPKNNPIEYILESIKTIYSIKHKNGAIRRVNVNIAATTVENYRKLKEAGIGTYILFQETYHKDSYLKLHPTGPKHDYAYHTEAMDRAMEKLRAEGYNPYYVIGGGHNLPGGTCFVDAVRELKRQCDETGYKPDYVFLASGTGSTQAGIVVGLDLVGWSDVKCVGISVARQQERGKQVIAEFANMLAAHYGLQKDYTESILFNTDYLCGGYEQYTSEMKTYFEDAMRKTGLMFDTTYSGKGFYGMMQEIKKLHLEDKNIVFWHTGGLMNIMK